MARRSCPKFLRIILDVDHCDKRGLTPFVRIGVDGCDRKEVIVAQHISGSSELYIAVVIWPAEVTGGQLEVGMLGCGDRLGVQVDDKRYTLSVERDSIVFVPWGEKMEEGTTGDARGLHMALFVNESTDKIQPIGILGSAKELGNWNPNECPEETLLSVKHGPTVCAVPLDPSFTVDRQVEFKMVSCVDGEHLIYEHVRNKKARFPAAADVVIWSKWGQTRGVQVTPVLAIADLSYLRGAPKLKPRSTGKKNGRPGTPGRPNRPKSTKKRAKSRDPIPKTLTKKSPGKRRSNKARKSDACQCSPLELFCKYANKL
jgi:hypothetical protein